jgi:hypothetical protein
VNNSRKKTLAIVLRRTDFGEADRIINLLTPNGKQVVIARGVRKPKSKLAGGIEFFSLNEVVLIEGKSEIKTLSSARMCEFFGEILKDFERTDFAYQAIKKVSNLCEHIESVEFFEILLKVFRSLNDFGISLDLVRKWFILKIAEFSGDEINLETDKNGKKLHANLKYDFDFYDKVFVESFNGKFDANDIKFLRLMVSSEPKVVSKIKGCDIFLNKIEEVTPRF